VPLLLKPERLSVTGCCFRVGGDVPAVNRQLPLTVPLADVRSAPNLDQDCFTRATEGWHFRPRPGRTRAPCNHLMVLVKSKGAHSSFQSHTLKKSCPPPS